jgi:hypothetical protein
VEVETKLVPVTLSVNAAPPAVAVEGESEATVGNGFVPVPVRLRVWGLPDALSVTLNAPTRVLTALGVKVTSIVQPTPGLSVAVQLFVSAKSPALTPVIDMLAIFNGAFPLLLRPTFWA